MILDVFREKQKIDHLFKLSSHLAHNDELLANWAKYLCVLTSGFIENSLRLILKCHVANKASPEVVNFVESKINGITNLNEQKISDLLGSFSSDWKKNFSVTRTNEQKDAIDSVVANRHLIAHGRSVGLTLTRMKDYYEEVVKAITLIDEKCVNTRR